MLPNKKQELQNYLDLVRSTAPDKVGIFMSNLMNQKQSNIDNTKTSQPKSEPSDSTENTYLTNMPRSNSITPYNSLPKGKLIANDNFNSKADENAMEEEVEEEKIATRVEPQKISGRFLSNYTNNMRNTRSQNTRTTTNYTPKPYSRPTELSETADQQRIIVLMVAEKPSIAKTIASALCKTRPDVRKGIHKFCSVWQFTGQIFNKPALFKVTSIAGHIFAADFPAEYQDWRSVDPESLFDAPTIKKEINPENQMVEHLQHEAEGATYLVLWLPNDREGENECFEVLDNVGHKMLKINDLKQTYRARFSALTTEDINETFRNLSDHPNINESKAVDTRQIIDLKLGVAFSRFQTRQLRRKFPNLNSKLVTFGPCQTPTLAFCVERDDQIRDFEPQTYYQIVPIVTLPNGTNCELTWSNDKTSSQEEAERILIELQNEGEAVIYEATNRGFSEPRPFSALNTIQMLKLASSYLGLGPHTTMKAAEKLYLSSFITYPRTECVQYPIGYDFVATVRRLSRIQEFSEHCSELIQQMSNPKSEKNPGNKLPIIPTFRIPIQHATDPTEWKLYIFIAQYFLATLSSDAQLIKRWYYINIGKHKFHLQEISLLTAGFTNIAPWTKLETTRTYEISNQKKLHIVSIDANVAQTEPPKHLTESDLISLMEEHGIGTDASMAQHVNNICERNFVQVQDDDRKLVPTEIGVCLIHGYQAIDADLVSPFLRAEIERGVEMIAKGKADHQAVLREVLDIYKEKFYHFKQHFEHMEAIFQDHFGTFDDALRDAKEFSSCGQCGNKLLFVDKFNKLNCTTCKNTLTLPQNGTVRIAGDRHCAVDYYQVLIFTPNFHHPSYLICPMCSNQNINIEEGLNVRLLCNICPDEKCQNSEVNNRITPCDKCNLGMFVLCPTINNELRIACNKCAHSKSIAEQVLNVSRGTEKCRECDAYIFKELAFLDGTEYTDVCVFCTPELSSKIKDIEIPVRGRRTQEKRNYMKEEQDVELGKAPKMYNESSLQVNSKKIVKMEKPDQYQQVVRRANGMGLGQKTSLAALNNDMRMESSTKKMKEK